MEANKEATPLVDALTAKWDDDGASRGPAYIQMRDLARVLECSKDRLVADVASLRESGKKIIASETERTAEVIRQRAINDDLIAVLEQAHMDIGALKLAMNVKDGHMAATAMDRITAAFTAAEPH